MPPKIATVEDLNYVHRVALEGLPRRLSDLRSARGLSQTELAERIGAGRGSITTWENGVAIPDLPTICLLAERFGVSVDWLALGRGGDPNSEQSLEARCAAIPLLNADEFGDQVAYWDRLLGDQFEIEPSLCVLLRVVSGLGHPAYAKGDFIMVQTGMEQPMTPGDFLYDGVHGNQVLLRVIVTGEGLMAFSHGRVSSIREEAVGRLIGRVVAKIGLPCVG